jgi:hypothetical protein
MPSHVQTEHREGNMTTILPENLTFSEVGHLPIVKDFAKKIKLVDTLDAMVDSKMELSPGITMIAMEGKWGEGKQDAHKNITRASGGQAGHSIFLMSTRRNTK